MQTIITRHGEGKLATKVFVSSEDAFNVTSVIVMGKKECVLIDCQWTRANAHRVVAEILETGLELKAIYATHAHHRRAPQDQRCQAFAVAEALHLHDNDGVEDLHIMPYTGKLDWERVARSLGDIRYKGTINFEVGFSNIPKEIYPQALAYVAATGRYMEKIISEKNEDGSKSV